MSSSGPSFNRMFRQGNAMQRVMQISIDSESGRLLSRIVEDAAIGDVRPHDLRHTMATRLFVADAWTVPQVSVNRRAVPGFAR